MKQHLIAVREYTSAAEMVAAAAENRRKLFGQPVNDTRKWRERAAMKEARSLATRRLDLVQQFAEMVKIIELAYSRKPVEVKLSNKCYGYPIGPCPDGKNYYISVEDCIVYCSRVFGVDEADIVGKRQDRKYCLARHAAIWLARKSTACTLVDIGKSFSWRDHTAVVSSCHAMERRLEAINALRLPPLEAVYLLSVARR